MSRTDDSKIVERISTAIYFITSFFDEREPLKWRLRLLANDLVSYSIKNKSAVLKEMVSLFSISKSASLVSDVNYEILISELSKVDDNERSSLSNIGFVSQSDNTESLLPSVAHGPYPRKIIKDNMMSLKKNSRQEDILNIIKRKKEVMIRDISPLISGCSDKTIQRELLAMVKDGILKKSGEKRWSRYSLA